MQQKANTPKEIQKVKPRAVVGSVAPQFVINNNRNEDMISTNNNFGFSLMV
jgi:hypothetical protein